MPCAGCLAATSGPEATPSTPGILEGRLSALNDPEGLRVPADLPPVVDAHVHLFPDGVFRALHTWFEAYGWPVRYPLMSPQVIDFQLSRGVEHLVALHYAHKPGMARGLNRYIAELSRDQPRITGLATVLPGEPDAVAILEEAFDLGLKGVKLHCHVQCFAVDEPTLAPLYALCAQRGLPMVIHAGREPKSPAYRCDPHEICHVDRVEAVLREHPRLTLCVPHLGADEFQGYARLLDRYDTLWLDTTMMLADFFPTAPQWEMVEHYNERVLFGTDFPNLPFAWDRELLKLRARGMAPQVLENILHRNAQRLYGIEMEADSRSAQ